MKGRFSLEIESRRVIYQLSLERKVTVIKGNSGTGKTSMIRILSDYVELGKDSGVHIRKSSDYDIKILENRTDWHQELEQAHNCIMFVDEDVRYLYDKNFQSVFQGADCYIVIISRSGMFQQLPYAISSIYELQTRKNGKTSVVQMYRIYHERFEESSASHVITEDSNAGYEMMQKVFTCPVDSANGNSNVLHCLVQCLADYPKIAVLVDGAAFGGYISAVMKLSRIRNNVTVLAPESFEYLLLKTYAFEKFAADELTYTWKYCDSRYFLTWERYFTDLLAKIAEQNYGFQYSKRKLHTFFLNESFIEQVRDQLADIVCEIKQNG